MSIFYVLSGNGRVYAVQARTKGDACRWVERTGRGMAVDCWQ